MTSIDLHQIEKELRIAVPEEYRTLITAHADHLHETGCRAGDFSLLFVDSSTVIRANLQEREQHQGTDEAFPDWWKTFFLIGTNGGGDYYCLRLDNAAGVWMIGSDCGDEPTLIDDTFQEYVNKLIAEEKVEQRRQADTAQRRLPYQKEVAAQLATIECEGDTPQDARDWWLSDSGYVMFEMLDNLAYKVSPRQLRLFGLACCRLIPGLDQDKDFAAAIQCAEDMTRGTASATDISETRLCIRQKLKFLWDNCESMDSDKYRFLLWRTKAVYNLMQDDIHYLEDSYVETDNDFDEPELTKVYDAASYVLYGAPYGSDVEMDLLREVLGNPFAPAHVKAEWRSESVVAMARKIYDGEKFDQLPELATALSGAGCEDSRIIEHCHRTVGHIRGCWVLDQILQNEIEST